MRLKELSVELWDSIVSRHRSGEGYQKTSAAWKVPKNTVATIILKWKKFGTTKTLPRAGHPVKLSNLGEKVPCSGRWPRTQWSLWQSSRVCRGNFLYLPNHGSKPHTQVRVSYQSPSLIIWALSQPCDSQINSVSINEFSESPLTHCNWDPLIAKNTHSQTA